MFMLIEFSFQSLNKWLSSMNSEGGVELCYVLVYIHVCVEVYAMCVSV